MNLHIKMIYASKHITIRLDAKKYLREYIGA